MAPVVSPGKVLPEELEEPSGATSERSRNCSASELARVEMACSGAGVGVVDAVAASVGGGVVRGSVVGGDDGAAAAAGEASGADGRDFSAGERVGAAAAAGEEERRGFAVA